MSVWGVRERGAAGNQVTVLAVTSRAAALATDWSDRYEIMEAPCQHGPWTAVPDPSRDPRPPAKCAVCGREDTPVRQGASQPTPANGWQETHAHPLTADTTHVGRVALGGTITRTAHTEPRLHAAPLTPVQVIARHRWSDERMGCTGCEWDAIGTAQYPEDMWDMHDAHVVAMLAEHGHLVTAPTAPDVEAVGMDLMVEHRSLRARGLVHQIHVMPNENHTGWIISVDAPSDAANLPQPQAEVLGRLLLAGPGDDPRPKCRHGKPRVALCLDCLADTETTE